MEQGLGFDQSAPSGSIDKSRVLDVRPLRCLAPVFPNTPGMSSITTPNPSPFVCVPPSGPFPAGVQPFYPFMVTNDSQQTSFSAPNQPSNFGFGSSIPAPVPLNSFRTPPLHENGSTSAPRRATRTHASAPVAGEDDIDTHNLSDQFGSGFGTPATDANEGSNSAKRRGRPKKRRFGNGANNEEIDVEALIDNFLTVFKLKELDDFRRSNGDRDITGTIILVYDLLRRRLTQIEEARDSAPGHAKRPDLKAANLLMTKGVRTNCTKRIGHVPGVEIGDIFFLRMELCLVGLHAPSMAGIDYMSVKITMDEEPIAVSIVSSGGYDDDGENSDVLVYSGQGGVQRRDGQMFDQKLERGNLALEKSLHRANDVRVIRGIKDLIGTGKIYVYDGLYRIQESWAEKNKSGCNVFKYKMIRVPGQPEAFSIWKSIQQWKDKNAPRSGTIIPDLTSGVETLPVALVNDVDGEKGPAHFSYIRTLRYSQPFAASKLSPGCHCSGGCEPGDPSCPCGQRNGGFLPYSSIGVLLSYKSSIHECGPACSCPTNCRNRLSQGGIKLRLEVFKTKNKGWGLRSWDPIRGGGFICEYAGDVIKTTAGEFENDSNDNYIFDASRFYEPLEPIHDAAAYKKSPLPLVISAKNSGNVSRFMNHSCSPNVTWQPVLRENNNDVYLNIAFFSIRHIPPMQELTFDYGIIAPGKGDRGKKRCFCGSVRCRGYFY